MIFKFQATHPEDDEEIVVTAEYFPRFRGSRDRYGVPEEPDSPEEVLIKEVTRGGKPIYFAEFEGELEAEAYRLKRGARFSTFRYH